MGWRISYVPDRYSVWMRAERRRMAHVSKTVGVGKHILRDINLSFFQGAKIGVIGVNGTVWLSWCLSSSSSLCNCARTLTHIILFSL